MNIVSAKSVTVPKPHFGLKALSYNQNTLLRQQKLSRGLNEESIRTVRELAYKDVLNGVRFSDETASYVTGCMNSIEPDREKLLAEAEAKVHMAKRTSAKAADLLDNGLTGIWKYMFKEKSIAPDVAGGLSDGKSFAARIGSSRTYIEVYNENGEVIGCYDSVNAPNWDKVSTTEEHQCYRTLEGVYNEAYDRYMIYAEAGILTDTDPAVEQAQMTESLDIYV